MARVTGSIDGDAGGEFDQMTRSEARRVYTEIKTNLTQQYPGPDWHVNVNLASGLAMLTIPDVTTAFGMEIKLDKALFNLGDAAKYAGGELLERFRLSPTRAVDTDGILKDAKGNAIKAKAGEL